MRYNNLIYVGGMVLLLSIVSLLMLGCPDNSGSDSDGNGNGDGLVDALACDAGYYEVDGECARPSGSFVAVGADVVNFGVEETDPRGTAAIGDTLYMIGNATNALYTVNTTDGTATIVGSGLGLDMTIEPRGLAAVGDTLYMIADNDDLFEVDTTTGMASDSSLDFGVMGAHVPQGLAAVPFENEVFLLMATVRNAGAVPTLYGLNTRTSTVGGSLLPLTTQQFNSFPQSATARYMNITGVTVINGAAFAVVNGDTDAFYSIDTSFAESAEAAIQGFNDDSILTQVGSADAFGVTETAPRGLAAVGNNIYMIGSGGLYRALTESE